eukprot:TRINITY_DN10960_c0_g1_i1.p1 TRINITY_DN10960_c0_g1~~TRINITY_DN10960_c0_g1_i1.p1  ORF type:complete len:152 (+),score=65.56 TRINITY_DN10960_c0_g1_i1:150-605(+)
METITKDICTIVADKCVNSDTDRPFTVTMIERALKDIHFNVNVNKSAKSQALELIRLLQDEEVLPIERAQMRVHIVIPGKGSKDIKAKLAPLFAEIEDEEFSSKGYDADVLIDPGHYREIDEIISKETKGSGSIEVMNLSVLDVDDDEIEL